MKVPTEKELKGRQQSPEDATRPPGTTHCMIKAKSLRPISQTDIDPRPLLESRGVLDMNDDEQRKAIEDIDQFITQQLFGPGSKKLQRDGERLFDLLMEAKYLLKKGGTPPPLLLLEIFILSHFEGHTPPLFVMDWLASGAHAFHQHEGEEPFERGLGFTSGRGQHSGQGHEFRKARREQLLNRYTLFTWIRMLNIFEKINVDRAVGIVHEIHTRELSKSFGNRKSLKKPLSFSELHSEYRAYKDKKWDGDIKALYLERWKKIRNKWLTLIQQAESESK
jgi:hypothetical protein